LHYLITGGAGFIGSHLVDVLLEDGEQVTAVDDLSTGNLGNLQKAGESERFRFVEGSVLDEKVVDDLISECDAVVHLAAAVGVKLVVEHPLQSMITNIRGTENTLASAHRHSKKVLIASTSEVYGKSPNMPLAETADRLLGPPTVERWGYSTSKAVDEVLAAAYHRDHGLRTVVVRPFNTAGPRQSPAYGMVIPRLVRQAVAGEQLTVFGDGTQTRCFCHVSDVVDALVRLLREPAAEGEVFNIGRAEEISIRDLAQRIKIMTGSSSFVELIPYERAYEAGFEDMSRRVPDTRKIAALTGWLPRRTLDEILEEAIAEAEAERSGS
jgi:UDP-glucose 4-epimerase